MVTEGLPYHDFEKLRGRLGISSAALAPVVGISERTLARRKKEGCFKPDEPDRLCRLIRLYRRAAEALGEDVAAERPTTPKRFLGGKTPLAFADTEIGAHEIDQALGHLEHGVCA